MRKLASVQKILELNPIEGKDRIVLATVLGWHVIVQKEEYKVEDLCIYCEPDSLMPEKPEFEFLRSKKYKIKVMKMAGVLSEGICFPLSILPEKEQKLAHEGMDVTDILGVKHCDEVDDEQKSVNVTSTNIPYIRRLLKNPLTRPLGKFLLRRNAKLKKQAERFPSFIKKTDETRIQTVPWVFNGTDTFVCREKLDGSSLTVFLHRKKPTLLSRKQRFEFGVCSRNRRLVTGSTDDVKFLAVAEKYHMEAALRKIIGKNEWVAIQGEMIGQGVQGNTYKLDEVRFYAFNLIIPTRKIPCTIGETILKACDIPWVPLVGTIEMPMDVEDILNYATGKSAINPDVLREGVVCRNYIKDISFKAVSPDYLIKKDNKKRED